MDSLLNFPNQHFALGANSTHNIDRIPPPPSDYIPPPMDTNQTSSIETFGEDLFNNCNWGCVVYLVASLGLFVAHFWLMIGPLHNWAKANFSLISLTIWSIFSFSISLLYLIKSHAWFLGPRWLR